MARASILEALGDIARDKGISRERLQEVIQEAVTAAARRKFKDYNEVEARINETSGELEVFRYKTVTDNFSDPENEISLDEARKLDSSAEPGDEVEYEIDNHELSRVIAQTARQLIFQKIREAERETIYENFKDRKGEILNGIVSRTERNRIFITFNQVEAILYKREQIPNERYSSGEHIRVMLLDVINDPKEPSQLVISRADPMLLIKLFEMEVPEIYDAIVEIVAAAREAGRRAKIAVRSNDQDVDPVGTCVGMRGSRVQSIIAELRGEKIDIINWTDDLPTYIANALAPAELTRIRIDDELQEVDVEVEPDQLSLAIGRQGQNVRLASKLIGYKININSTQDKTLTLEEQIRERLLASQAQLSQGEGITAEAANVASELNAGGDEAAAATETTADGITEDGITEESQDAPAEGSTVEDSAVEATAVEGSAVEATTVEDSASQDSDSEDAAATTETTAGGITAETQDAPAEGSVVEGSVVEGSAVEDSAVNAEDVAPPEAVETEAVETEAAVTPDAEAPAAVAETETETADGNASGEVAATEATEAAEATEVIETETAAETEETVPGAEMTEAASPEETESA